VVASRPAAPTHSVVIAREGGRSGTPRQLDSSRAASAYWMPRLRGAWHRWCG